MIALPYIADDAILSEGKKPRIHSKQKNRRITQDATKYNEIVQFRGRHLDDPERRRQRKQKRNEMKRKYEPY